LAQKKSADTPLALAGDLDRLADSRLLLEWVLEQTCTPQAPAQPLDKLVKKVDQPLRDPLAAAVERRLQDRSLPDTVGAVAVKGKSRLYLKRMPPPKEPVAELAEKLVQALRARRDRGEYPVPFRQLLDDAAAGADPKLLKKALKHEAYEQHVVRVE